MALDNSTALQEKSGSDSGSNAIASEILIAQNVIRNKFEKACLNRLGRDHDVKHAMKSITASPPPNRAHAIKSESVDANELCNRLRLLLSSSIAGDVHHTREMSAIIAELRELGIIV